MRQGGGEEGMLELHVAVAKVNKYASSESGDTVEMIERPQGGFSVVMVDGQGSGRGAKTLSNLVTARAITMLKDGARDGAVARAAHDYLYGYRHGQVSATLNIVSIDFSAQTLVMSRNNPLPFYVLDLDGLHSFNQPSTPIGLYSNTKPIISQHPLREYTYIIAFTDGVAQAGERYNMHIDLGNFLASFNCTEGCSAQTLADRVLLHAMERDQQRPNDDMSVLVVSMLPADEQQPNIRRMDVRFPLERPRK